MVARGVAVAVLVVVVVSGPVAVYVVVPSVGSPRVHGGFAVVAVVSAVVDRGVAVAVLVVVVVASAVAVHAVVPAVGGAGVGGGLGVVAVVAATGAIGCIHTIAIYIAEVGGVAVLVNAVVGDLGGAWVDGGLAVVAVLARVSRVGGLLADQGGVAVVAEAVVVGVCVPEGGERTVRILVVAVDAAASTLTVLAVFVEVAVASPGHGVGCHQGHVRVVEGVVGLVVARVMEAYNQAIAELAHGDRGVSMLVFGQQGGGLVAEIVHGAVVPARLELKRKGDSGEDWVVRLTLLGGDDERADGGATGAVEQRDVAQRRLVSDAQSMGVPLEVHEAAAIELHEVVELFSGDGHQGVRVGGAIEMHDHREVLKRGIGGVPLILHNIGEGDHVPFGLKRGDERRGAPQRSPSAKATAIMTMATPSPTNMSVRSSCSFSAASVRWALRSSRKRSIRAVRSAGM